MEDMVNQLKDVRFITICVGLLLIAMVIFSMLSKICQVNDWIWIIWLFWLLLIILMIILIIIDYYDKIKYPEIEASA